MSQTTNVDTEEDLKTTLINCLSQQLSEIEMLQSIYPKEDEFCLSDCSDIDSIKFFLENKTEYLPNYIDFALNLCVDGFKLEVSINLPSLYPNEQPDVLIRCNNLNRHQEVALNSELSSYIKCNHVGEICIFTIITWVQDYFVQNIENIQSVNEVQDLLDYVDNIKLNDDFVRIWIVSHHIYSKKKREEIVKLAKDLHLTGFCLPGKPGIVCIEGLDSECKEWWKIIKSLTWKKIGIRKTETFIQSERKEQQKFYTFNELQGDMSDLSKLIEQHGLSYAFNEIFGFSNPS